jgi:hypothetical protein
MYCEAAQSHEGKGGEDCIFDHFEVFPLNGDLFDKT